MINCERFYDNLAKDYHHIFGNWENSIREHAKIIDTSIKQKFSNEIHSILDSSCGIGTQLIGLSELGYTLTGSDISKKAIKEAKTELKKRKIKVNLHQCNFLYLDKYFTRVFDLIIAFDNSIPHLITDEEISVALKSMYKFCKYGIMLSIRDYDDIDIS